MTVVDASLVVDWVAPDVDPDGRAGSFLDAVVARGAALVAPRLMPVEVANALLTGCRRGRWGGAEADRAFTALRQLPVGLIDTEADLDRAWDLSRRYDEHPIHDMVYVALAERLQGQLVTQDQRLLERLAMMDFVISP